MAHRFSRTRVLRALYRLGCTFIREGGRHSILRGPNNATLSIPRHTEVAERLVQAECAKAGIAWEAFLREY
jgi:hypothetical protein